MLENNLKSEHRGKERKRAGRLCRSPLSTSLLSVAIFALFPIGLAAQTASSAQPSTALTSFGTTAQNPLRFAGESAPENQVSLSLGASALYDDNVQASNAHRVGDEAVSFTSNFDVSRQTERLTIDFDYVPFFVLYRQTSQYDRLNHAANLALGYRLSPRYYLDVHDSFKYVNGVLATLSGEQIFSGPTAPGGLNQGIFTPTLRTLSNTAGLDLTFTKSHRTSLTFSVGYNQLKFGSQAGAAGSFYNGNGANVGLEYQYQVTRHTSFGLFVLHEDTTYQGGEVFGSSLRTQTESLFVAVGSRVSPTVSFTLFGGPQFLRVLGASPEATNGLGQVEGAGGGSITKEVRKTALNLSVLRSVADSGGVYTSAIDTNIMFGVRRRIIGHWVSSARRRRRS